MSLQFILGVKTGPNSWFWMHGLWTDTQRIDAESTVNVAAESTKSGTLTFDLGPHWTGEAQWKIDLVEGASLEIDDLITGNEVVCHPGVGYPPARPDLPYAGLK